MATVTRSFYAARGDYALHGLNLEFSRVPLTLDAVIDFQASRRNDGVQLSLFYTPDRPLFLQVAAPEDGSWFLKNGFASNIDLIFSAPVDKASITSGTFTWRWSGGESAVGTGSITYLESDRQLRIPAPTLPLDYMGSLVLTFADVDSAETDPLSEVVSLHFDITEAGSIKAQPGASAFTRPTVTGYLGVGRLVVPFGQNVEQMVRTYLEQKSLDKEKILKVVQLEGSNKTLEIFLLWWQTTSPKVLSITPRSSGTIVSESPPSSILLQFDQPVPNPADYFEFDGVDGTDVAFTVDQLDNTGRQWRITKAGGLFATDGQHTLKIIGLPNVYGELAGPPMLFSWQVQPLMGGTSNSGASVSGSWKFDTSIVVADPGNKKFRVNNATLASVTQIYFNDTTVLGFDASTILGFLNTGDRIYVQQKNDASMAALFVVTAPATDNTGWWTVPVMVLKSGTLYQNAAECAVVIAFSVAEITDHGALSGLGDDDHTQYHNNTRGDTRYDPLGEAASEILVHEGLADPHPQYNADSNRFFASGTEINSRVLISPLPSPGNFAVVSAVAYAVYLGRTTVARVWQYIEFELRTIASGSQTAELGLFSTPNPPSKAGQTLTELESTALVDTMIAGPARMIRNTVAFVGTLPASTHLWAVFRCVMGSTQPVTGGHAGDMGQGWILTATPGSINGIGSYAGSVPSFTVSSVSPALRITAD